MSSLFCMMFLGAGCASMSSGQEKNVATDQVFALETDYFQIGYCWKQDRGELPKNANQNRPWFRFGFPVWVSPSEQNGIAGIDFSPVMSCESNGHLSGFGFAPVYLNERCDGVVISPVYSVIKECNGVCISSGNVCAEGNFLQIGVANIALNGALIQLGAVNFSEVAKLLQLGAVNFSGEGKLLQLGAVNLFPCNDGFSVGLLNVCLDGESVQIGGLNWRGAWGRYSGQTKNGIFQLGVFNRDFWGIHSQVGVINRTDNNPYFQFGLVNLSDCTGTTIKTDSKELYKKEEKEKHFAIQFGLWNSNGKRSLPLINMTW